MKHKTRTHCPSCNASHPQLSACPLCGYKYFASRPKRDLRVNELLKVQLNQFGILEYLL